MGFQVCNRWLAAAVASWCSGPRSASTEPIDRENPPSYRRQPPPPSTVQLPKVLSVLLETMDRFRCSPSSSRVFFLATCPDAAALDPSLLQRGRLEAVLRLGALDGAARASILSIHARGMALEGLPPSPPLPSAESPIAATAAGTAAVTTASTPPLAGASPLPPPRSREEFLELVAARCHGYLGSDLERLCREAALNHLSTTAARATGTLAGTSSGAKANDDFEEKRGGGGGDGGGAGVRLQDFWAALNIVRPASLAGHSVGMWGDDVRQQVRWWLGGRLTGWLWRRCV